MASFDAPTTHDRAGRRADPVDLYLDLVKECLTRSIGPDPYRSIDPMHKNWKRGLYVAHLPLKRALGAFGIELVKRLDGDPVLPEEGIGFPAQAETIIGMRRLDNLQRRPRRRDSARRPAVAVRRTKRGVLEAHRTCPLTQGNLASQTTRSASALDALYDKVSPGAYMIVNNYYAVPEGAGRATDDFRAERGIKDELIKVDWAATYWQRW